MNKIVFIGIILLCGLAFGAFAASDAVKKAQAFGARGKISLHITDTDGINVTNANVNVAFSNQRKGATILDGMSDNNGFYIAVGTSDGDLNYTVTNVGCYRTSGHYWFYLWKEECVEDGRWIPWNPVLPVTLKRIVNPIPMYARRVDIEIPEQNKPLGYDLEKADWIAPYGKGVVADFNIIFTDQREGIQHFWKSLTFRAVNPLEGLIVQKMDEFSTFVSAYNAPIENYLLEYAFERKRTRTEILISKSINDNEYFILRSRVTTNTEGVITSARYSKIYGPIEYAAGKQKNRLRFIYYFNPTPNDRNLEFDPQQNLFGKLPSGEAVYKP
ncbi:MAG: hypothetical protein AB7T27_07265 [Kiritimatiellia bacterium]